MNVGQVTRFSKEQHNNGWLQAASEDGGGDWLDGENFTVEHESRLNAI